MSEYNVFMEEKNAIDNLINRGYFIINVTEELDGAIVEFENKSNSKEIEILHIKNPESRKYFSNLIIGSMMHQGSN